MDIYEDRTEAGRILAYALEGFVSGECVVFGIPRGGVVVAAEVVKVLHYPLDIVAPRKIGAPEESEYAIGAVCPWGSETFINERAVRSIGVSAEYIEVESAYQMEEANRRLALYRDSVLPPDITGKTAIVVDDGVATGYTTRAALSAIRNLRPIKTILAVPVGPPESLAVLRAYADDIVCPMQPPAFGAVGRWYKHFEQTTDAEVISIMRHWQDRQV